jgi:hypothetical protein
VASRQRMSGQAHGAPSPVMVVAAQRNQPIALDRLERLAKRRALDRQDLREFADRRRKSVAALKFDQQLGRLWRVRSSRKVFLKTEACGRSLQSVGSIADLCARPWAS